MELATAVAANAPLSVSAVKRVLDETTDLPEADAFRLQDQAVASVLRSEDAKEGSRAFAEKRSPAWRGR